MQLLPDARLPSFPGQPVVLSFARDLPGFDAAAVKTVQAELRGLGAILLLVTPNAVQCFRADDAPELEAANCAAEVEEISRFLARYGVSAVALSRGKLAVLVLDGSGRAQLRAEADDSPDSAALLLEALRGAGTALTQGQAAAGKLSRRELALLSLVGAFALALEHGCKPKAKRQPVTPASTAVAPAHGAAVKVALVVNEQHYELELEPRVSLLDTLRERLALTGSKKGCDHGQCGACTVLLNGVRVNSCLVLAVMAEGAAVTTIEALAKGDELHPLQRAFVSEDALQCGYCTPGQIMSGVGLIAEDRAHTDAEVREHMSGNICRCGAYNNIVSAIQLGRKKAVPA
jgi:xanthine dehydrogenase YagT iron-sulfur-binding subunit